MALDTSDVLDLSKENIQPLRQGRKAAQLKTALQAQSDPEVYQRLLKQREIYEYQIRMYEGDDPFEPYYKYVLWLEQSFPSGCEKNLFNLLEDTLLRFKDCDQYKQDPRLVQLLIKYINFQPNPLELYQLVYNQGLGTMCSMLYKAWAEELDKSNDFKKADEVLQLGLRCRAQPFSELEEFHVQFQLSVARRFLDGYIDDSASTNEPARTVLSKLKPSKVKTNRSSRETPGVLMSAMNKPGSRSYNNSVTKFQVYEEDTNDERAQLGFKNGNFPKGSVANRENTMAASKWCGQKFKQSAHRTSVIPATPPFEIHEDKGATCQNLKTTRPDALRIRKTEFRCPVAVFEPPDPRSKPMYPKHLVYVGGRDVQLEEIRAAYYWRNIEKIERENKHHQNTIHEKHQQNIDGSVPGISNLSGYPVSRSTLSKDKSPEFLAAPTVTQAVSKESHVGNVLNSHEPSNSLSDHVEVLVPAMMTYSEEREDIASAKNKTLSSGDYQTSVKPNYSSMVRVYEDKDCTVPDNTSYSAISRLKPCMAMSNVFLDEEMPPCQNLSVEKHQSNQSVENIKTAICRSFLHENAKPESHYAFPNQSAKSGDFYTPSVTTPKSVDDLIFSKQKHNYEHGVGNKPSTNTKARKDDVVGFGAFDFPNTSIFHYSPSTSMTVNTKAAMNVIQQMWESPLTQQCVEENAPVMPNKYTFSVYCEDTTSVKSNEKYVGNENVPTRTTSSVPFAVYCEDTILQEETTKSRDKDPPEIPRKSISAYPLISRRENKDCGSAASPSPLIVPVNLPSTPLDLEDKENMPLKTYRTPTGSTPPIPVDVYVDSDKEDEMYGKVYDMNDETCDTRAFAIKLPSSTPAQAEKYRQSRKSLAYDGSDMCDDTFSYVISNPKPLAPRQSLDCSKKANKNVPDLSLILENSKEQGSNSSGSTGGNAGSKFYNS